MTKANRDRERPPASVCNLLVDPVFTVAPAKQTTKVDLPTLLSRLGAGIESELCAVRPHQQHPVFAFMVQLAALVLERLETTDCSLSPKAWRNGIRQLLEAEDDAFCLSVADLTKPAFMQPPVPEEALDGWWTARTPDQIDTLITAKNHDVKRARIHASAPEHWAFALITLQTSEGYLGRNTYGISRMNGGLGNRPALATVSGLYWHERFATEVGVWLRQRDALVAAPYRYSPSGPGLLWTLPWDGTTQLAAKSLHPFYIEICRRARLTSVDDRLEGRATTTNVARIGGSRPGGDTGDIWTPVNREERTALTLSGRGFTYDKLQDLSFGKEWIPAPAQVLTDLNTAKAIVVARALVRGHGKTEGLHERTIRLPDSTRRLLATPAGRAVVGRVADRHVEQATTFRTKILRFVLQVLIRGELDWRSHRDKRVEPLVAEGEAAIDAAFFHELFDQLERGKGGEGSDARWQRCLVDIGERVLAKATQSLPVPIARRHKAHALADLLLRATSRAHLPQAFADGRAVPVNEGAGSVGEPPPVQRWKLGRQALVLAGLIKAVATELSASEVALLRRTAGSSDSNLTAQRLLVDVVDPLLPVGAGSDPMRHSKWAFVLAMIAEASGTRRGEVRLGIALARAAISEERVLALLRSTGERLAVEALRLVRVLEERGELPDLGEVTALICCDENRNELIDQIARDFFQHYDLGLAAEN